LATAPETVAFLSQLTNRIEAAHFWGWGCGFAGLHNPPCQCFGQGGEDPDLRRRILEYSSQEPLDRRGSKRCALRGCL